MRVRKYRPAALLLAPVALAAQFWAVPAAFGQAEPVYGLNIADGLLSENLDDPIVAFGLADEPLAATPDFDFRTLNASEVFEAGVENIPVDDEADVEVETAQHLRALQAVATAENALTGVANGIASAEDGIRSATDSITDRRNTIRRLESDIAETQVDIDILTEADDEQIAEQARLNSEITKLNAAIVDLAIQAFTGEDRALETIVTDPASIAVVERRILTEEVREFQRADIEGFQGEIAASEARRATIANGLAILESENDVRRESIADREREIDEFETERDRLESEIIRLTERGEVLQVSFDEATEFTSVTAAHYQIAYHERLTSFVAGTDVPLVALNAYVRASRTLAVEDPSCGIHWSQLAGIGRIESFHGYFGESTLDINGNTTTDILGLSLDGRVLSGSTLGDIPDATGRTQETGGVKRLALIRDSDDGVLDGDRQFDRAVGPMQFIPTTWRLYDADGNDDGQTDPQNIYDAALASAHYLCDAPGSMLTAIGEQRAYFAYNHDIDYSHDVTNAGRRYHRAFDVTPEPRAFTNFARTPTAQQFAEAAAAEAAADAAAAEAEAVAEAEEAAEAEEETDVAVPVEVLGATESNVAELDLAEPASGE